MIEYRIDKFRTGLIDLNVNLNLINNDNKICRPEMLSTDNIIEKILH